MVNLNNLIKNVDNFPKKGIVFKDITPILYNSEAFKLTIDLFCSKLKRIDFDTIIAPEARGFIFAGAVAYILKKKLVLARKFKKLPNPVFSINYTTEYSEDTIYIQKMDLKNSKKIIILDDILATGDTVLAITNLIENKFHSKIIGCIFILSIPKLDGIKKLNNYICNTLI